MRDPLDKDDDNRWFDPQPDSDEEASRACKKCGNVLRLHQPDPQMPELILGICIHCKAWYLFKGESEGVEITPEGTNGVAEPHLSIFSQGNNSQGGHL